MLEDCVMVEIEDMVDLLHFYQHILLALTILTLLMNKTFLPDGSGKTGPLL